MAIFAPEITLHFSTLPPSLCLLNLFIRLEEKLKKKKYSDIFKTQHFQLKGGHYARLCGQHARLCGQGGKELGLSEI